MQIHCLYNYRILDFYRINMIWCFLHDFHVVLFLAAAEDIYQLLGSEILTAEPMEEGLRNYLLYRFGIEDCTALLFQQRQVVRQIINGLFPFQTPFVLRNTRSAKIDGDCFWRRLYGDLSAAHFTGYRVVIAVKANGAKTIHTTGTSLAGVKGILWKRVKILLFLRQHEPHVGFLAPDLVGQILPAFFLEQSIQLFHGIHPGNRDAGIPSAVTHQALHKTLFISGCGIAENGFESIVGRQSSIPGLFPGMSAETILNSNFSIVEDDSPGDTAEVLEYLDQGIQKAFFILPSVCQNQRCTAVTEPGAE